MVQDMFNEFETLVARWNIAASPTMSQRATFVLNRFNSYHLTLDGTPVINSAAGLGLLWTEVFKFLINIINAVFYTKNITKFGDCYQ